MIFEDEPLRRGARRFGADRDPRQARGVSQRNGPVDCIAHDDAAPLGEVAGGGFNPKHGHIGGAKGHVEIGVGDLDAETESV